MSFGALTVQPPTAAPLLPNERALLAAQGKNPDDFMALWVHPAVGGSSNGIQIGNDQEGNVHVVVASAMPAASLVATSKLIITQTTQESIELASWGTRILLPSKACNVAPVEDHGWEVAVNLDDADHGAVLLDRIPQRVGETIRIFQRRGDQLTALAETITLYEAQAIYNTVVAAGFTATMSPLPKHESPTSTAIPLGKMELPELAGWEPVELPTDPVTEFRRAQEVQSPEDTPSLFVDRPGWEE